MQPFTRFKQLETPAQLAVGVLAIFLACVFVTLLIAGIVIGSAVIGTFVLGLDDAATETPKVQFDFEQTDGSVEITHTGGDAVDASRLVVSVDGERTRWSAYAGGTVEAGDSITVSATAGDRIRIIYTGDEGETVLDSYRVG